MDAGGVIRSVRVRGGLSQADLARLAGVAASTVSRIERGELEPTWALVNRLLESTGYRPASGLASTGDLNAVAAARIALGDLDPSATTEPVSLWLERWKRARFIDADGRARDVEKVGTQAGIAARLFDRKNSRLSVVYDRPWQEVVSDFRNAGLGYAVSGITATSPSRIADGAAWPLIYVESISNAVAAADLREQTTAGPRITIMEFDDVSATGTVDEGGYTFVSSGQALIDSYSGPGRMPDQADSVASKWQSALARA